MQRVADLPLLPGFEWRECAECEKPYAALVGDKAATCPLHEQDRTLARTKTVLGQEGQVFRIMDQAGVNVRRFRGATLETFDPTHDPQALAAAQDYLQAYQESCGTPWAYMPWLFLYGSGSTESQLGKVGNGKTHLGVAIARQLLETGALRGEDYAFTTAESLLLEIEGTYKADTGTSVIGLLRRYEKLALLHIDDFGVRRPSPHAARIFDELTKRREGRATIWTSNLSPGVIARLWEARIASRIAGEAKGRLVALNGPDRRLT